MSLPHRFFNGRFAPVNTFVSGFCLPGAPRADQKRPGQLLAPQWKGETAADLILWEDDKISAALL